MKLVLSARSAEEGEAFTAQLVQQGVEAVWVTADASMAAGARTIFDAAQGRFGNVDLLVNNAAHLRSAPFLELDEATYRDSFERNVRLVYELSLLVARQMAKASGGSIIHISSVGGLRPPGQGRLRRQQGAIDALTRAMAMDLASHHIRVNAVAPGAINTRSDRPDPRPRPTSHSAGWVCRWRSARPWRSWPVMLRPISPGK